MCAESLKHPKNLKILSFILKMIGASIPRSLGHMGRGKQVEGGINTGDPDFLESQWDGLSRVISFIS